MKIKPINLFIPFIYSGLFFIHGYFGNGIDYSNILFFFLGISLGVVLMFLDEFRLHQYYLYPNAAKVNLMTRSLLFVVSLLPMGIFLMTSTGSEMGTGLFLGIVSVLLLELIEYRKNVDRFHERFLFQLKRKMSASEIDTYVLVFGFLTLLFILMMFVFGG